MFSAEAKWEREPDLMGCEPNAPEPKAKGCSAELTREEGLSPWLTHRPFRRIPEIGKRQLVHAAQCFSYRIHLFIPSIHLFIHLSILPSFHPSIPPSISLSMSLLSSSIYPSIHPPTQNLLTATLCYLFMPEVEVR